MCFTLKKRFILPDFFVCAWRRNELEVGAVQGGRQVVNHPILPLDKGLPAKTDRSLFYVNLTLRLGTS
jgi:hypothetical protein